MLIDTMTGNQLYQEYHADLEEIRRRTLAFDKSKYVDTYLRKHNKQDTAVITQCLNTQRNNRYLGILIYEKAGTGKVKGWNWSSYHIAFMETSRGIMTLAFYEKTQQTIVYTPHFFRRYKERMYNIADWKLRLRLDSANSIEDIAKIYIERNPCSAWIRTRSVFYNKMHIFSPVSDGVALMQWNTDRQVLQGNTFVTPDMLNEKQIKMAEDAIYYLSLDQEERTKLNFPDFA